MTRAFAPPHRFRSILAYGAIATSFLFCVFNFNIFVSSLPTGTLDNSWSYVLDWGSAQRLPFGIDLVFTYGPLSLLGSSFFVPQHEVLYRVLSFLFLSLFFIGFFATGQSYSRYFMIVFPFVLAETDPYGPSDFYFVLPLSLVYSSKKQWANPRWGLVFGVVISCFLGLLPLDKATMTVPAVICVIIATFIQIRRGSIGGILFPISFLLSFSASWLILGQEIWTVIPYFQRQFYIAAGYTSAMSSFGDPKEVYAFLICAAMLVLTQCLSREPFGWSEGLSYACILFVAFKAGFVRHDAHALASAGTLTLVAFVALVNRATTARAAVLVITVGAATFIRGHYLPVDPAASLNRFVSGSDKSIQQALTMIKDPDQFRLRFELARKAINKQNQLPKLLGTVDLYSYDQGLILATDMSYYPRPSIQSYSAYTPELASLDSDHLDGPHAPDHVLFAVEPIDQRFPALEDGKSWPNLLSLYKFKEFTNVINGNTFAILDRMASDTPSAIGPPIMNGRYRFDEDISVPADVPFVWSSLTFHPSWFGRFVSTLWKLPFLTMDVTYLDGGSATYRMIAGMSTAGFLLSPVVSDSRDFVTLRSTNLDALVGRRLKSIRLHQNSSGSPWGHYVDVQFSALNIPADPDVDVVLSRKLEAGTAITNLPVDGKCNLDTYNHRPIPQNPITVKGGFFSVEGWAMSSSAQATPANDLRLALTPSNGGPTLYAEVDRFNRPDVDAYFKFSKATNAGFRADIATSALQGPYTFTIVHKEAGGLFACPTHRQIEIH